MKRIAYLLTALTVLALVGPAGARTVTTAAELSEALLGDDVTGTDFDLRVRVSRACSPTSSPLGVWDDSGAALLTHECDECDGSVRDGDLIRVAGHADYTSNGFIMTVITNLEILAHGDPPPVTTISADEIPTGRHDHRLVRLVGTLSDVEADDIDADNLFVTILSGGRTVLASVPAKWNAHGQLDDLLGHAVAVSGMVSLPDLTWRRLIGRYVSVYRRDGLVPVLDDGDRFAAPPLPRVLPVNPTEVEQLGQRRAGGRVIAVWNNHHLIIQSDRGTTLRVTLFKAPAPAVDDEIEVVGFPRTDFFSVELVRAAWRPTVRPPTGTLPPVKTDLAFCLADPNGRPRVNMSLAGRAVTLRGTVRESLPTDSRDTFILEDGLRALTVDASALGKVPSTVIPGASVELTGVFVAETEDRDASSSLPKVQRALLVLRSPDDLRLLARAPFWTSSRLLCLNIPLLVTLVILLLRSRGNRVRAELKARERTHLAVELHDSLSQTLTAVSMEIATASALKKGAPAEMVRHLGLAERTLQSCRDELRNCLWDLRSSALDKPNLTDAILTTLKPHVGDGRLAVRFSVPRGRLSDDFVHAILRIVRELVLNAVNRGGAASVRVAGCLDGGRLAFSVTDDGCGFDPKAAPGVNEGHFGLQGVRERLDEFGGTIEIESRIGHGTTIRVSLPIDPAERERSARA